MDIKRLSLYKKPKYFIKGSIKSRERYAGLFTTRVFQLDIEASLSESESLVLCIIYLYDHNEPQIIPQINKKLYKSYSRTLTNKTKA